MTLKEAKDQVAKKYGQRSWSEWNENRTFPIAGTIHDEAAELYARSKWDDACEDQKRICNEMLQEPGRKNVNSAPKPEFKP